MLRQDFFEIRQSVINSLDFNSPTDSIEMLIKLYDINKRSSAQEHLFLTNALGNIGDDKVIPILMEIANNNDLPINIRTSAVEILSRKNAPELVHFLVEMLGNPISRDRVNEFALDVMGDLSEERMILALLESYQLGRNKYFSLLHTIMNSLDNFENPQIKSVYKEIANNKDFPNNLRIKAFKGLTRFTDDPEVVVEVIKLLNEPENYMYYEEIINLLKNLDIYEDYKISLREAAFKAMQKSKSYGNSNE